MPDSPKLPMGWPCIYYIGAEYSTKQAIPATCLEEQSDCVVLLVKSRNGGTETVRKNVHHITDPWHAAHPEVSRQSGAWDYIDGMPLPFAEQKTSPKKLQTAS